MFHEEDQKAPQCASHRESGAGQLNAAGFPPFEGSTSGKSEVDVQDIGSVATVTFAQSKMLYGDFDLVNKCMKPSEQGGWSSDHLSASKIGIGMVDPRNVLQGKLCMSQKLSRISKNKT